jgi:hypothetical protein
VKLFGLTFAKQLKAVKARIRKEISNSASTGQIAAALSTEGFAGGYQQALLDVELASRGINPDSAYWNYMTMVAYGQK